MGLVELFSGASYPSGSSVRGNTELIPCIEGVVECPEERQSQFYWPKHTAEFNHFVQQTKVDLDIAKFYMIGACRRGEIQIVQSLLEFFSYPLSTLKELINCKQHTINNSLCDQHHVHPSALLVATLHGHKRIVRLLLRKGANMNLYECPHGSTAWMYAISRGLHGVENEFFRWSNESETPMMTKKLSLSEMNVFFQRIGRLDSQKRFLSPPHLNALQQ